MKILTRRLFTIVICGFLFAFDRFLKWQALHAWHSDYLMGRWFGWHPFLNPGVAFGIPIPNWATIIFTVPILAVILFIVLNQELRIKNQGMNETDVANVSLIPRAKRDFAVAQPNSYFLILIFAGAFSNFLDRIFYGYTVDYWLILTAVINLADVMIVVGFVVYFVCSKKFVKLSS